jgi:hypothetical protein
LAPLDWACKTSSTQKSHASLVPAGRGFFCLSGRFPSAPRAAKPNVAFPVFLPTMIFPDFRDHGSSRGLDLSACRILVVDGLWPGCLRSLIPVLARSSSSDFGRSVPV